MISCVDTHAHVGSARFEEDRDGVVARARAAGVGTIVSIACDLEDSRRNLEFAKTYAGVAPTAGIHPLYVHELPGEGWLAELGDLAGHPVIAAIGEIGLDYFHPPADGSSEADWRRLQRSVFEAQLQLATDRGLPVVVHQRNSSEDVAGVLANFPEVTAVLHCFTGTQQEAETALAAGHLLSFTGILTFPSAEDVRSVARSLPLDRIMIETDCPYLAPIPHRGKRCEPAHVVEVCRKLAELHDISMEEAAGITTENARRFFRELPDPA